MDVKSILSLVTNIDMTHDEFNTLMGIVRLEPMSMGEPRLERVLEKINFGQMCRHLILHYDGEKRCRFFDYTKKVTDPFF